MAKGLVVDDFSFLDSSPEQVDNFSFLEVPETKPVIEPVNQFAKDIIPEKAPALDAEPFDPSKLSEAPQQPKVKAPENQFATMQKEAVLAGHPYIAPEEMMGAVSAREYEKSQNELVGAQKGVEGALQADYEAKNSVYADVRANAGKRSQDAAILLGHAQFKADENIRKLKEATKEDMDFVSNNFDKFTMDSQEGDKVPDAFKIDEYAKEKARKKGLPEDGYYVNFLRNEAKAAIAHKIIEPQVLKERDKLFKEKTGQTIEEAINKDFAQGFKKAEEIQSLAEGQIKSVAAEVNELAKADIDSLTNTVTQQTEQLNAAYQQAASQVQDEEQANVLYADYQKNFEGLQKNFLDTQNQINGKYNARLRRQADEIEKVANQKFQEEAEKYQKEYKTDPKLLETLRAVSQEAYKNVVGSNEKIKEARDLYTPALSTFGRTFTTSFGGSLKGISSTLGFDKGKVIGEYLENVYQPGTAELKQWGDLLSATKLAKSSGQLAGAMLPSMTAAAATALATEGLGAPVAVSMISSGLAGWAAESTDIAGRMYEDTFAETGDANKALKRSKEVWDSQLAIMPAYAFEALPFLGKSIRLAKGAGARVALGAGIEVATEFMQEYPQNLFEEAIKQDKPFAEGLKNISASGAEHTLLNILPVAILGGAGQLNTKSDKEKIADEAKSFALKSKFSDIAPDQREQFFFNLIKTKGEQFAFAWIGAQYTNGTIDRIQANELVKATGIISEVVAKGKEYGFTDAEQKVYSAFKFKLKSAQEKAANETDPILKQAAENRVKELEEQTVNFASGKQADYVVIEYPNGEQYVLSTSQAQNAVKSKKLQQAVKDGAIKIEGVGKGKDIVNSLTEQIKTSEATPQVAAEVKPEKTTQDAIQEQKPNEMDVRQQAEDGKEMGEGNQADKAVAEQGKAEEKIIEQKTDEKTQEANISQAESSVNESVEEKATSVSKGIRATEKAEKQGIQFDNEKQLDDYIASESENDVEMAETYLRNKDVVSKKDYKSQMIDDFGITMTEDHYGKFGDKNTINQTIAKKYIRKNAPPLDTQLLELSEIAGVEITEQDVIDHIEQQNKKRFAAKETPIKTKLKDRYRELFGKELNPREARKLIDQELNRLLKQDHEKYLKNEYQSYEEAEAGYEQAIRNGEIPIPDTEQVSPIKRTEEVAEKVASEKEQALQALEDARKAFKIAMGNLQSGGLSALPEFVNLVKAYVKAGYFTAKEIVAEFKKDFPEQSVEEKDVESILNPPTTTEIPSSELEYEGEKRKYKIGRRVLESDLLDEETKKGFKDKGIEYLEKRREVSRKQAADIISSFEAANQLDELTDFVLNDTNAILPDVRTMLMVQLRNKYAELGKAVEGEQKEAYNRKSLEIMYKGMQYAAQLGRGVNAQKEWQTVIGINPDLAETDAYRAFEKRNAVDMEKHKGAVENTAEALRDLLETEEGQELLAQKIEQGTEAQLKKYAEKKFGKSKVDQIDAALAKFQTKLRSRTYDATIGVPVAILDGAITTIRKAIYAGSKISEAVQASVDYIKSKHKGPFNEEQFAKDITEDLKDAGITDKEKKDVKVKDAATRLKEKLGNLDQFIKDPEKAVAELEERKKKAEERAEKNKKSEEILALEKEIRLKEKLIKLVAGLDTLTDKQKKDVINDTLDTIIKNGYLSDASFKNTFAKALGLDHLTEKDVTNIRSAAEVIAKVADAAEAIRVNPSVENVAAFRKAFAEAQVANEKISRYFQTRPSIYRMLGTFIRGNLLATATAALSFSSNVLRFPTNFGEGAVGDVLDFIRMGMGKIPIINQVKSLKGEKIFTDKAVMDYAANQSSYYSGWAEGVVKGFREMLTGSMPENIQERELHSSLHPKEALERIWKRMSGKEKDFLDNYMKDALEGTLGWSPEIMFRILNLTDKPFRNAAEKGALSEFVSLELKDKKKELESKPTLTSEEQTLLDEINSGRERIRMMENPPAELLEKAREEGAAGVFQNKNIVTGMLETASNYAKSKMGVGDINKKQGNFIATLEGLIHLIKTTQIPYVNMPLNWGWEMLQYANPIIPATVSAGKFINGDIRGGQQSAAKAIIAIAIGKAALWMVANGLVTGSGDDDDPKERAIKRTGQPSNTFNVSLFNRIKAGQPNNGYQAGDYCMKYLQLGIQGATVNVYANMNEKYGETQLDAMKTQLMGAEEMMARLYGTSQTALDQSMVKGVNGAISALAGGKENEQNNIIVNTARAFEATVLPNTLTKVISAADKDNILRNVKDESVIKWIGNQFREQLGLGNDLPAYYSIWGQPAVKNPKDVNAWVYQLFDFSKGAPTSQDYTAATIYNFWNEMREQDLKNGTKESSKVIPEVVGLKSLEVQDSKGNISDVKITTQQQGDLQRLVGLRRKELVDMYVNDTLVLKSGEIISFATDTPQQRIKMLDKIYKDGYDIGFDQFKALYGFTTPK